MSTRRRTRTSGDVPRASGRSWSATTTIVIAALLAAACSTGESGTGTDPPTTTASTTTTTAPATTLPPTTTTTGAATTTTAVATIDPDAEAVIDAYVTAWNAGDLTALTALFAPDVDGWFVSHLSTEWEITVADHLAVFEKLAVLEDRIEVFAVEPRDDGRVSFKVWHHDALLEAHGADPYLRAITLRVEDGRIVAFSEALAGWLSYSAVLEEFQSWLTEVHPDVGDLTRHKKPGDVWDSVESVQVAASYLDEYAAFRSG